MLRNFDQLILDLNGQLIQHEGKPLTLTTVAINALLANYEGEQISGQMKADRMQLAMRINEHPTDVDLPTEQIAKLKELIGRAFTPLIVGRAYALLEQEPRAVALKT